jgi:hypothetical protein
MFLSLVAVVGEIEETRAARDGWTCGIVDEEVEVDMDDVGADRFASRGFAEGFAGIPVDLGI